MALQYAWVDGRRGCVCSIAQEIDVALQQCAAEGSMM
jgi:hypothetical protein